MIGQMVKFKIPILNGQRVVCGVVKRLMADGKWEVKSQNDGYFVITISEML